MSDAELLLVHAERIRASGVLGRSPMMQRLFEFLLACSLENRVPKEIEVAMDAFGKGTDFAVSQDAIVRVYVHKLRRKLEGFYSGSGKDPAAHLAIPKGEYRFVVERPSAPDLDASGTLKFDAGAGAPTEVIDAPIIDDLPANRPPAPDLPSAPKAPLARRTWILVALALSLLVNAAWLFDRTVWPPPPRDDLNAVRKNPIWAPLFSEDRPIFLVVGDYYIFGESNENMEIKRLVREFNINSPQDLDQYLKVHPDQAEKYLDLELSYLPTASAYALRDLMPLLAPVNRRVHIVTMSQLNPQVIKTAHVIYVGFLSGLGRLREVVFSHSRLKLGDSYDEIVDRKTNTRYVSQAGAPYPGAPFPDETNIRDYGYFATFKGPEGNRIVVIAGPRDLAAMHMAETLTAPRTLAALAPAQAPQDFEALYEVYGMDRLNLDGKLLFTAPFDASRLWTGTGT